MWTESFARCDHPPVAARWSNLTATGEEAQTFPVTTVSVNYQDRSAGGCDNTNVEVDGTGWTQRTNTPRSTRSGSRLSLPRASSERGRRYHARSGRLAQLGERCPYKAEVGGSSPSTPTPETLVLQGFQLLLGEVDDLVLFRSRQKVGSRCVGGRVEGIGDVAVEAFEEVSVDVENGPHRRVTEPGGDH